MDTAQLDLIRTVVQVVAFGIGGAIGMLWGVKNGWFRMQSQTVDTYKAALEALDVKVADLEARIAELERRNETLRGEIEGKEMVITELVAAISESGMCQKAWECDDRIIPVDGRVPRRKKTIRKEPA